MKNIHVLLTDKPSRLTKALHYSNVLRLVHQNYKCDVKDEQYQHIYITSDEEIKEGDWIYHSNKKTIFQVNSNKAYSGTQNITLSFAKKYDTCKKIILTTDQDLIKDGVQEISNEFLEWFVKNPSCEFVKVYYRCDKSNCYLKEWNNCCKEAKPVLTLFAENESKAKYFREQEIIIPKEEQKSLIEKMKPLQEQWQKDMDSVLNPKEESELKCDFCKRYPRLEGTNKCENCYSVVRHILEQNPKFKDTLLPDLRKKQETLTNNTDSHSLDFENFEVIKTEEDAKIFVETMENIPEPNGKLKKAFEDFNKQEKLEEAIEIFLKENQALGYTYEVRYGFIKGAKWQQEQNKNLYSEEDLKKAYKDGGRNEYDFINKYHCKARISFDKWFEQFKKK